jgi:hypothetical protein
MMGNRKDLISLAIAILISPVVAAALAAILLAVAIVPDLIFRVDINSVDSRPATMQEIAVSLAGFGVMGLNLGAVLGWPAMLLGGLPVHRLLMRRGLTGGLTYALSGTAVGIVTLLPYLISTGDWWLAPAALFEAWPILLAGPATGFLAAGLFWLIRRPDRLTAA